MGKKMTLDVSGTGLEKKPSNTVAERRPDLLELWDWEKNGELGISPYELLASSNTSTWWKCTNHPHSYCVRTRNVTYNNQGCPYCAGKQVLKGFNDLASVDPQIAEEWDYELNDDTPDMYTFGSHHKAAWVCSKHGVKWSAEIGSRVRLHSGCPKCKSERMSKSNSKPKMGGKYLSEAYPEISEEWYQPRNGNVTPEVVAAKSGKPYYWKCKDCGLIYKSLVCNRTNLGEGCPDCARKRVGEKNSVPKQKRSIAELYPNLVSEWHPTKNGDMTPYNTAGQSGRNVWWKCSKCGCEYESKPMNRSKAVVGCPDCLSEHLSKINGLPKDGNSLAEMYPEIAAEWHPTKNGELTPFDVSRRSNRNMWWLCSACGFEWEATPSNRVGERSGCPSCSKGLRVSFPEKAVGYYISQVFPDMEENAHPEELGEHVFELDIWIPSIRKAVEYDGQAWHKDPTRDLYKNAACSSAGITLIRIREPECPDLEDGLSTIIVRSDYRGYESLDKAIRECLSILGHDCADVNVERDWQAIIDKVRPSMCDESIDITHPEVAAEWHPTKNGSLVPSMFTRGTATKVWWKCSKCGYEYETRISHRCDGHGCRSCASSKVAAKRATPAEGESLLDRFPEIAAEWHTTKNGDLKPSDVKCGSNVKVWWTCSSCGKEWSSSVAERTRCGHAKCRSCITVRGPRKPKRGSSLRDVRPDIAETWHPTKNGNLKPSDVSKRSGYEAWWICPSCGNEWKAPVCSRAIHHTTCKSCSLKNAWSLRGEQDS